VFSITNKGSFDNIVIWVRDVDKFNPGVIIPKLLVGNMSDLENERVVSFDDGSDLANQIGAQYYEASAKEGTNIEPMFQSLCNNIYNKQNEK